MAQNHGLKIVEGAESTHHTRYQPLVGKLIYLSHTRPDVAYAVGVVSQFMHAPQAAHWEAALRIVRYLKGTPGHGVMFENHGHLEIHDSQTLTGQEIQMTENQLQGTSPL